MLPREVNLQSPLQRKPGRCVALLDAFQCNCSCRESDSLGAFRTRDEPLLDISNNDDKDDRQQSLFPLTRVDFSHEVLAKPFVGSAAPTRTNGRTDGILSSMDPHFSLSCSLFRIVTIVSTLPLFLLSTSIHG